MSKLPPLAPTASAVVPYHTVIKIVGRPGTGSLPSTIAPADQPPPPPAPIQREGERREMIDDERTNVQTCRYC